MNKKVHTKIDDYVLQFFKVLTSTHDINYFNIMPDDYISKCRDIEVQGW